jgi:predicted site-specific integrase-resolvase
MKIYSISEFSKLVNRTTQTIRNWDKTGYLKPISVSKGGFRYYSQEQLEKVLGVRKPTVQNKTTIGYCRVSSQKQKDDLGRQVESVKTFMIAKGYSFEIIQDIGSGINYNKKGLLKLIDLIVSRKIDRIVILYKDRLLRFGFELIKHLCDRYDVIIETIDNSEKTEEQEVVEDLVQIITVFSCKLQGKRANKAKKILSELKSNDSIEKN